MNRQAIRGVDGCAAGWLSVECAPGERTPCSRVYRDAKALFGGDDWIVTAIDIPIGIPTNGPRACDLEARRVLGPRRSSVFPAPLRCTLSSETYEHACDVSFSKSGKKLSKQAFAILPKIRQVDEWLRLNSARARHVYEVHPEVCFAFWNEGRPMRHAKLSGFGFTERFQLVERCFPGAAEGIREKHPVREISDDDILDALATLWTANRIHSEGAIRLIPEDEYDELGLPMNMWA